MPKINHEISVSNYELIRDKLGAILFDELSNQHLTFNVREAEVTDVLREAKNPIDHVETSLVNVSLAENIFDNKHQGHVDGSPVYNVDVYVKIKSKENEPGDQYAQYKLQRLIGIIRAIIEDPQYKTLAYTIPFIRRVMVLKIEISDTVSEGANIAMGRLIVQVDCVESTELLEGVLLQSAITQVKLGISDKGYKYVYDNDYGPQPLPDNRYVKIVDDFGNVLALLQPPDIYTVTALTNLLQNLDSPTTTIIQEIPE